jgi:ribosome assembly protein 1
VAGIVKSLNLNIPPKQLESKDRRQVLSSILSQWLSLVSTTVQSVIEVLPSPRESQMGRLDQAILRASGLGLAKLEEENQKLATDLATCNAADDSYIIGYISKMFAVSQAHLPIRSFDNADGRVQESSQADEALLGFARLYSGTLRAGTKVSIVRPKYNNMLASSDPRNVDEVITVTVGSLYLMMGRELRPCHEIKAGNIFAISGLEDIVFRSATICAYNTASLLDTAANGEPHAGLLNLGGRSLQV